MKIIWSEKAKEDLYAIEDFISNDNILAAINFVDNLIEQTQVLLQHPEIGRIVPEVNLEHIRELIVKNYRIVYKIFEQQIEIVTVFEGHKLIEF